MHHHNLVDRFCFLDTMQLVCIDDKNIVRLQGKAFFLCMYDHRAVQNQQKLHFLMPVKSRFVHADQAGYVHLNVKATRELYQFVFFIFYYIGHLIPSSNKIQA